MKIALLDIHKKGDHKDYNGGYGTSFEVGDSKLAKILSHIRASSENAPLMNYGYLAAICKGLGHNVYLSEESISDDTDLIIVHATLIRHNEEMEFMSNIRKRMKISICTVGPLSSKLPHLFKTVADTVVIGEPEKLFLKVKSLNDMPIGETDVGQIENLDLLPFPDWTIYDYKKFSLVPALKKTPMAFVLGSRSCPYKCNYCPYILLEKSYKSRSVNSVVDELEFLRSKYNMKSVMFRDPIFTQKRNWVFSLCDEMQKRNVTFEWGCETRTDRLDEELIDRMFNAGLRCIKIGVESFDHDFLDQHKRRPPAKDHQEKIISYAENKGIRIVAFYMLGLPDDTHNSSMETIKYSQKMNTSFANFSICTPLPGTDFYEEMKDKIFDHNFNHYDNFHSIFHGKYLKPDEVKKYQEKALVSYYFRFQFIVKYFSRGLVRWF
jgi:anaerobic magnesium-protoporphyrin IX monomethyl ester cyclase